MHDSTNELHLGHSADDRPDHLVVHTSCGRIRGPVLGHWLRPRRMLFQQCSCHGPQERWPDVDVSRLHDLCVLCARGTAGGLSRWSWLVCHTCRVVVRASDDPQVARLPIGRHSIMNSRGVQVAAAEPVVEAQTTALLQGFDVQFQMYDWCKLETAALVAANFPDRGSVPLAEWEATLRPDPKTSRDATARFMRWAAEQPRTGAPEVR
jgi:hypothetical protein